MPRWLWWAPFALLTLVGAIYVFRLGFIAATITETDVINRYAADYVAETGSGAALADCHARPGRGEPGIWIVVVCAGPEGVRSYHVNRFGGLEYRDRASPTPTAPQT
ncbi:hypothetical protein [Sulfitobacter sp. JB4-11]|uniref:hypothetical protein n=1 Tax=Sulfitobacter rhodophyticola TaxID=3238304 RepID=UPI00351129FF